MWIVYHGRWVWTTGRFRRGARIVDSVPQTQESGSLLRMACRQDGG